MKTRLDKLLVERGLVTSRERAHAVILAGRVLVNDQRVDKAGSPVDADARIRLLGSDIPYVSRGGLKLEHALQHWSIDLIGRKCMDVGTSTGGFSDCMLQHGAEKVVAVDTGYGQIHMKIRGDVRVRLMENTNARNLTAEQVPEDIQFVAMDVSFISATLVLPAVVRAAFKPGSPHRLVVLVKPQFEAGRENVGKGGIVRDPDAQRAAVDRVRRVVEDLGGREVDVIDSPILGAEGNREFLLYAEFP